MNGNTLKDWKVTIPAAIVILGGGGFGGGTLMASTKITKAEAEVIVERHPVVVTLKNKLKDLGEDVEEMAIENKEAHKEILNAIKELDR